MENQRLLLYFTLFFIVYLLWSEWQMDYGPKPDTSVAETTKTAPLQQDVAEVPEAATTPNDEGIVESGKQQASTSQRIKVITDVLDIEIDTRGGDIRKAVLRKYSKTAEHPEEKLVLMEDTDTNYFIAQSGLVSVNADTAPTHNAVYKTEKTDYRLAEGVDEIRVPLQWTGENGVRVKKIYTLRRNQ